MDILSALVALSLSSLFWILAFVKLQKIKGGLVYFLKHLLAAIIFCTLIGAAAFQLFINNESFGFEGLLYIIAVWLFIFVCWFVWSLVLFNKAKTLEKNAPSPDTHEDILDNQ